MTTRRTAEALLFEAPLLNKGIPTKAARRRLKPIYCPICTGWVEVRLNPVRLRYTRFPEKPPSCQYPKSHLMSFLLWRQYECPVARCYDHPFFNASLRTLGGS